MNKSRILLCVVMAMLLIASVANAQARVQVGPAGPPGDATGPCTTVGTVSATPFTDSSQTNCGAPAAINDYSSARCDAIVAGYPGPEVAYEVFIGAGNTGLVMTLTPTAPADLAIFMVSTCGDGSSCVAFQDLIGGGGVISQAGLDGDAIPNPLTPGSYYVYVDSYYAAGGASCGNFTLDVAGTLPVELLSFEID